MRWPRVSGIFTLSTESMGCGVVWVQNEGVVITCRITIGEVEVMVSFWPVVVELELPQTLTALGRG